MSETITIEANVQKTCEEVWKLWTESQHITKWNQASEDWHSPRAINDLTPGGKFNIRMEAKDGSAGFDFTGVYDRVDHGRLITYTMEDGRKVETAFHCGESETKIVTIFEAESENSVEMQKAGWQSILDSFKRYAEANE